MIAEEIDEKILNEIERIKTIKDFSQWEWDDVDFWDKKYKEKWNKVEKYS